MATIISVRHQNVDQIIRKCIARADVNNFQEPLAETAELVAELKESDIEVTSNTDETVAARLMALAAKNALLEARQQELIRSLEVLKGKMQNGEHTFDTENPAAVMPNFDVIFRGLFAASTSSSSSSSSSSASSAPSSALITLTDEEAAKYMNHQFVKSVRDGLGEETDMGDDDDLLVVNTNSAGNLKAEVTCPISQMIMTNPCTSKECKHSFDEGSILQLLKKKNEIKCPISGCGRTIKKADLERDAKIERKVKKYNKEQEKAATQRDQDNEEDMLHV